MKTFIASKALLLDGFVNRMSLFDPLYCRKLHINVTDAIQLKELDIVAEIG